ncbi:response regulator transcription factor [[Clostridium] polysaccharolyticum]|jgi:two-component system KDP operon response regulator KdpE|uniref:Stage 0 sporulation protein A homolog n=1 Tax=[Clostridium] polysaccharolyticum TaxID=29364 RepID=A0A1I0DWY8_9FIRM|nr:response regulator transcription factor [[Clostridium] polysaccharolyticum]SET37050.1 two-component system, OmpR family, KDP operon response regulator KdpE [[Clostridium] polysaccharolyticum]
MNKQTILIVEDEQNQRNMMEELLADNQYKTLTASTGTEALTITTSHCPDLILLDIGLPDINGIDVIQEIRTWSNIPILVVSNHTLERDIVQALDSGADDYITKPFGTSELLARIRAAYRHCNFSEAYPKNKLSYPIQIHGLEIDFEKRLVKMDSKPIHFTQIEFKILRLLALNAGRVLSYETIMQSIWGPYADKNNRILRVNMANIRRKLEEDPSHPKYIFTVNGLGYRLLDEHE